jgi:hypothetical protein
MFSGLLFSVQDSPSRGAEKNRECVACLIKCGLGSARTDFSLQERITHFKSYDLVDTGS